MIFSTITRVGNVIFIYYPIRCGVTKASALELILIVQLTWYIDAKEPIREKLLFLSPIRSGKGAYQQKTSLAI